MLKVEPREAANLQVPSPELLSSLRNELEELKGDRAANLAGNSLIELQDVVDKVLFGDMDSDLLEILRSVRDSKQRLYERRRGRGGSK